jgi:hypothetical protein
MNEPEQSPTPTASSVTERCERIYAAERRFDLVTLLTIMTAYAILFGFMSLFRWPAPAFAVVAVFVALVGFGQAFLFRGKAPRRASITIGSIYWTLVYTVLIRVNGAEIGFIFCMLIGLAIQGALIGYVCGVYIGGVFMFADFLRRRLRRHCEPMVGDTDVDGPQ